MTYHELAYTCAIFDLDGTILDSMYVWEKIDDDFLAKRGYAVPDDYKRAIRSMSFEETARFTIERFSMPETPDELMAEWIEMASHEYAERVPLKPGASELIRELRSRGVRTIIATSLQRDLAESALAHHGILDCFDSMTFTDEAGVGKHEPDVFLLAASRAGAAPSECAVFEDILPAVLSAKRAGMFVICVEDDASAADKEALIEAADAYVRDLRDAPLPRRPQDISRS